METDPLVRNTLSSKASVPLYFQDGFFDQLFFKWVEKFIEMNEKQPFQQSMHHALHSDDQSKAHFNKLVATWDEKKNQTQKSPLLKSVIAAYKKELVLVVVLGLIKIILFFTTPYMINEMMHFVEEASPSAWQAFKIVVLLPIARLLSSVLSAHSWFAIARLCPQFKAGLVALIYSKSMKISTIRSNEHSEGSIVNHYEIDCEKLEFMMRLIQDLIVLPIQLLIGIAIIYWLVGSALIGGIVVIVCVLISTFLISKKQTIYGNEYMNKKDARMKILTQILNAIKYLKMNGWEKVFANKIKAARSEELGYLWKKYHLEAVTAVNFLIGPQGVIMAVLGIYLWLGNEFDVKKMITMSSTFWVLSGPIKKIPEFVASLIECGVSLKRIEKFLLSEEVDNSYIKCNNDALNSIAIQVKNGNFSWRSKSDQTEDISTASSTTPQQIELSSDSIQKSKDEKNLGYSQIDALPEGEAVGDSFSFELKEINLTINKGEFIAIIGEIGSGKSSLFYSLAGEMAQNITDDHHHRPEVCINGNMTFLPQKPWIINASLKENILFGKRFDSELYKKCIHYAALEQDLAILPSGDETEIGEKGINLSGGQKARVSLARALYSEPNIFLLDDMLSAVDIHVGTFIIEECLRKYLAGTTRVLITHNLDYLKYVDYIYMLDDGRIIHQGTLDMMKNIPKFGELLAHSAHRTEEVSKQEGVTQTHEGHKSAPTFQEKHKNPDNAAPKFNIDLSVKGEEEVTTKTDEVIERLTMEEDRETGSVKFSVIKYFLKTWGYSHLLVWIPIVLINLTSLVGSSLYLAYWGDSHAKEDENFHHLMIYYGLNVIAFITNYILCAMNFKRNVQFSGEMHGLMIDRILSAPLNLFFDRVPSGRILNRFSNDIERIDSGMAWVLMDFTINLYMIVSNLLISIALSSIIVVIPVIGFAVLCKKLHNRYIGLNRELIRLTSISSGPIASHFTETLQGLVSVRSFRQQERLFNGLLLKQDELLKNQFLASAINEWFPLRCTLFSLLTLTFICVLVAFFRDSVGLTAGYAGILAVQMFSCCEDMSWFLWEYTNMEIKLISVERCHHFTTIEPERLTPSLSRKAHISNWPRQGNIRIVDYSTQYRPGLPLVLNKLNLNIKGGEKIGIVGRTGSGKSTLMLSLLRLLEAKEGQILIDDINIENVTLEDLRQRVTVIPQDPQLFEGTLKENVDVLSEFSYEEIQKTLEAVNLGNLTKSKEGLDYQIKSGGENLSAGEKQMVCIARALLKKSKVILIDEATSNIDMNNEEVFLNIVRERFTNCTVLMIAHRLKTIINCDKVAVMREGKVVEFGSLSDLLKTENGIFSEMWAESIKAGKEL